MKACIISIAGETLTADEEDFLHATRPFGVIVMGRSCKTRQQLTKLTTAIRKATSDKTLIFVDQEGGRVARLRAPEWPKLPAPAIYGEIARKNARLADELCYIGHQLLARELICVGINADCAPSLDVACPETHDVIGDRAFSDNPKTVAHLGGIALRALHDEGVASVIKHIPGHGRTKVDSHETLPEVSCDVETLRQEAAPFKALNHAPMAMTAHILFKALGVSRPATQSREVIEDFIRGELGFDGLIMTDDLGMSALGGTLADRAEKALKAGCDIILHCAGFVKDASAILNEMREVADVVPTLSAESLKRAERAISMASFEPANHATNEAYNAFYEKLAPYWSP